MSEFMRLEKLFSEGKITRRDFLAKVSALGLAAMVSPAILGSPSFAATPKRGGRLRIGSDGAMSTMTLDPSTIADIFAAMVNLQVRNCLFEIDPKSNLVPELVESFEVTPDAKKWIFNLRKGVEFHNGKSFSADDVLFTLNHHRDEKSKSTLKHYLDPVNDIKADGKYRVIIDLKEGNADFPYILARYGFTMLPAGATSFEDGMGTGGYILENFEPGVRAFTKRNPNYWKADHAWFDEVETIGINDVVARTNALKTGQIDVMNRCDTKTAHLLEKMRGIQLLVTGNQFNEFVMMCDQKPFDNLDARLAMKYAIDREAIVKRIFGGFGSVANDHPIPKGMRFHASELPQREYDPDKAKFHMKKAGLLDYKFQLHTSPASTPGVDLALLFKENAAKAGINIEVVTVSADGYWATVPHQKAFCQTSWWVHASVDSILTIVYSKDSPYNASHWSNDRVMELLRSSRVEIDEKKRASMYAELQQVIRDESGCVVPAFFHNVDAASSKLKFHELSGDVELDGGRLADRWWFES